MSDLLRLEKCFRDSFGLAQDAPVRHLSYLKNDVWDSLGHMRLIAAIETAFGIAFTTDEILDMSSFQIACLMLGKHGVIIDES